MLLSFSTPDTVRFCLLGPKSERRFESSVNRDSSSWAVLFSVTGQNKKKAQGEHLHVELQVCFYISCCTGPSSSSTPNSLIHVFMDFALCTGAQSCWNRKGPSPNCSHKVGSMKLSKMSWYGETLRVLFTGTKGPKPNPWKTTKLYTWYNAVRQVPFSW